MPGRACTNGRSPTSQSRTLPPMPYARRLLRRHAAEHQRLYDASIAGESFVCSNRGREIAEVMHCSVQLELQASPTQGAEKQKPAIKTTDSHGRASKETQTIDCRRRAATKKCCHVGQVLRFAVYKRQLQERVRGRNTFGDCCAAAHHTRARPADGSVVYFGRC